MSLIDGRNNNIDTGGGISPSAVKDALKDCVLSGEINLGTNIGATLPHFNITQPWEDTANSAYALMKTSYASLSNTAIPFFITTDQHGRGVERHRWANNIDVDGLEFANINLGDTVTDIFNTGTLNNMLGRTRHVKNYIGVVGNHDSLKGQNHPENPNVYDLTRTFISTYQRVVPKGHHASYTVIDGLHDAKYIVSDDYGHTSDGRMMRNTSVSSEYCDWLISELLKDDYDIVFLQHWPIHGVNGDYKHRDESLYNNTGALAHSLPLRELLIARKNKTSGAIVDDVEGNSHSFDFRNMEHELLCCLHGHTHGEVCTNLDGLTCYAADWLGNNGMSVFGLVDRDNDLLRIWKFSNDEVFAEFDLTI